MNTVDCKVCYNPYNTEDRRPLFLPCGHTFCSRCITNYIKEDMPVFVCYTCRAEHSVSANTEFPVNFELESILHHLRASNPLTEASKVSQNIEWLNHEINRDKKVTDSTFQAANSQLRHYKTELENWKKIHETDFQEHMKSIDSLGEIQKYLIDEIFRVDMVLAEGEKSMDAVRDSWEKLNEAQGPCNFFAAFQDAYACFESFKNWIRQVETRFPDKKLVVDSCKLRRQSISLRKKCGSPGKLEEDTTTDPKRNVKAGACVKASDFSLRDEFSLLSMQDKIRKVMDSVPDGRKSQSTQTHDSAVLKIEDLKDLPPQTRELLRLGRVFAAHIVEDGDHGATKTRATKYAKISLDDSNRLWLHVLGNPEVIPNDSFVLQYNEVKKLQVHSRYHFQCFLELGEGERSFGKLIINLHQRSSAGTQFFRLCRGSEGLSYLNTNAIKLDSNEQYRYESVLFGDYENNDGSGGKSLLPGIDWKADAIRKGNNGPCDMWRLRATSQDESKTAQFHIITKAVSKGAPIASGFLGKVVEGSHALTEAISQCPDVRRVYVKDCGVLL
ncbi:uncharacterized protein [Palaemon carinicauda]|uniref:uncharacterized protein n=1 Tax=Palaemon carinicauda TaxID=392227 RepID=UPI0035B676ED